MSATEDSHTADAASIHTDSAKSASRGPVSLALVLAFSALGAGGYSLYLHLVDARLEDGRQQSLYAALVQRVDGVQGMQDDVRARIEQLRAQLTQTESDIDDRLRSVRKQMDEQDSGVREQLSDVRMQMQEFRTEFSSLNDSVGQMNAQLGRGLDGWILREAAQLLVIANQRLRLVHDIDGAMQALSLADNRLARISDASVAGIRAVIADELAALGSIERIDSVAVVDQLVELADAVDGLPLRGDIRIPAKTQVEKSADDDDSADAGAVNSDTVNAAGEKTQGLSAITQSLGKAVAQLLDNLADMIQVEKNGETLRPVISAEARQLTYDKFKLVLDSAQVAFLAGRQDAYTERMGHAVDWLQQRFDNDNEQVVGLIEELDDIAAKPATTVLPDISGSLKQAREVISQLQ